MKTIFFLTAILMVTITQFAGCKKETTEEDISSMVVNTVWTGDMKYGTFPIAEPYIISFQSGNSMIWYDRQGAYNGIYTIDKDARAITMEVNAKKFKATIGSDKTLGNFQYEGTYYWAIINCNLNKESSQFLNNTTWKGQETSASNVQSDFQIKFSTGQIADLGFGRTFAYERKTVEIRIDKFINQGYYLILESSTKIKGIHWDLTDAGNPKYFTVELTKQ